MSAVVDPLELRREEREYRQARREAQRAREHAERLAAFDAAHPPLPQHRYSSTLVSESGATLHLGIRCDTSAENAQEHWLRSEDLYELLPDDSEVLEDRPAKGLLRYRLQGGYWLDTCKAGEA